MYLSRNEEFLKLMDIIEALKKYIYLIKDDFKENYEDNNQYSKLIRTIENQIKKNEESIKELREPFLLFVIGGGNYGKSTLINALLKEKLVQTTDLPNTWKLDLFIKSEREKIEITYEDNTKKVKNLKEGLKILKLEEEKYKNSRKKITALVKEYKTKNNISISDLKDYKETLEEKYLYKSNIIQIKYYINKGNILEDFIVVDTPGLNQTLLKNTLIRTKKYYEKADGVIWLIDAQNIVSKKSNDMIDEIEKIGQIHNGKKNIIAVINKIDIVRKNNIANVAKIRRQANEIYQNRFKDIVFISAKEALEGLTSSNEDLIEKSNINSLYESINIYFKEVSEKNQIDSKYKNLYIMKDNLLKEIYNYKRSLYKDISIYNEVQFEQKEKINDFKVYIKDKLSEIRKQEFKEIKDITKLKNEIENLQNICNKNLENIYEHLYIKSDFRNSKKVRDTNIKVYFTKSKYLVLEYNTISKKDNKNNKLIDKIENLIYKTNSKNNSPESILVAHTMTPKINLLVKEINEIVNEKLDLIENTLSDIRESSFREKHMDYIIIKKHIDYLDSIENIVKNLG